MRVRGSPDRKGLLVQEEVLGLAKSHSCNSCLTPLRGCGPSPLEGLQYVENTPFPKASGKRAGTHPEVFLAEGRHFQVGQVLVAALFFQNPRVREGCSNRK